MCRRLVLLLPERYQSHNTLEGLRYTMEAALALHNEAATQAKPPFTMPAPYRPEDIPAMNPVVKQYSCIECHQVRTAQVAQLHKDKKFARGSLWVYPPPDNVGLKMDLKQGNRIREVVAESFAAKAGLKAGDKVLTVNGARILSVADFRCVLESLEPKSQLVIEAEREGKAVKAELGLEGDWRRTSPTRRRSFHNYMREKTKFPTGVFRALQPADKEKLGIAKENLAIRLKSNPNPRFGSLKGALEDAGFRDDDIIVAFDGIRKDYYPRGPQYYLYIEHDTGDKVEVTFLRDGKEQTVTLVVP
jgi:serine protease Do